jgi:hypothetical protein
MRGLKWVWAASWVLVVIGAAGGEKAPAADPAKVDADFAIQGEYRPEGAFGGPMFTAQVIALGDHKFHARLYHERLPGDGWTREKGVDEMDGKLEDDVAKLAGKEHSATIKDGKLSLIAKEGNAFMTLQRVLRQSPALGAKPPEGATVLFDGKSADEWKGGKVTEDGLLEQGTTSKRTFKDCTLHIEFRLPYEPAKRGQDRGNSGVYMQGRYEVQVLDSFGLKGENNECGGIYTVSAPKVNMCYPPLSWQTYDIDFTAPKFDDTGKKTANAMITVKHNGVLIQENVEVKGPTTAAPFKESPDAGPIYLQDHGHPVRYQNIWVVEKK